MQRSETITDLAVALNKAQAVIEGALRASENPHFRSKYADLASVLDAVRKPFTDHGLSIIQSPRISVSPDGGVLYVELETLILHVSGQWLSDVLALPVSKADAQGIGSAITYARRYSLMAFGLVAPEDDDGNAASAPGPAQPTLKKPEGFEAWFADMEAVVDTGWDAVVDAWKKSPEPMRSYVLSNKVYAAKWDVMKAKAKAVSK